MKKTKTRTIVRCALIASLYTAVSLVLAPIAFGARTGPCERGLHAAARACAGRRCGRHAGCFLTNLVGVFTGGKRAGRAGHRIRYRRHAHCRAVYAPPCPCAPQGLPVAAAVPPVLINAVVVGAELAWAFGRAPFAGFLLQAGGVALGQLFSCFALGLPLVRIIEKTPALRAWFRD